MDKYESSPAESWLFNIYNLSGEARVRRLPDSAASTMETSKELDFWYPIHSYGSFSVDCRSLRFLSPTLFTMFLKNTFAMANLLALTTALAVCSSDCTLAACAPYDTCYGLGDGGSYNIGGKEFLVALGVVKSTQTLVDLSGISHSRAAYQAARKMMRVSI
jgi:hypothetical protein